MTLTEILTIVPEVRRRSWPRNIYLKHWMGPDSYRRDLIFFMVASPYHIRLDRHLMWEDLTANDWVAFVKGKLNV